MRSPLYAEIVRADGARPSRYALVLHGVFGSSKNWRLFMRRLAARCPSWGFVLADLRGHGRSLGLSAPHGVVEAAQDLVALGPDALGLDAPIVGVVGHSLGGKIALAYAALRATELDQLWTLDSQPGARSEASPPGEPDHVLEALLALPQRFGARRDFDALLAARGLAPEVVAWLAMNVVRDGDGYALGLELSTIRALLDDYFARDLWPELEREYARREVHVVVGGRSPVWSGPSRARLDRLAAASSRLHVHALEDAGHWVHVDAPEALLELMARELARPARG